MTYELLLKVRPEAVYLAPGLVFGVRSADRDDPDLATRRGGDALAEKADT